MDNFLQEAEPWPKRLLGRFSLSDVLAVVGFCVGCAFVTYVVRMVGYFSVVGPELLGMFLETDLIQGAIFSLPGVILLVGIIQMCVAFVFPLMERLTPSIDRLVDNLPRSVKLKPDTLIGIISILVFSGLMLLSIFKPVDDFGARLLLQITITMISITYFFDHLIFRKNLSIIWSVAIILNGYQCLYEIGRTEAQLDLKSTTNRYAISASDRSLVNVTILKSSSKALLIKVGNDVVMYDRSQISRIEKMPKLVQ